MSAKRNIRMSIPTEDFIALIQERPQLWQKSHPDFQDRELRSKMLHNVAIMSGVSAQECARKLKMLKDTMRARIALLPRTASGGPDFSAAGMISWPYFHHMLFMKDEFINKALAPSPSVELPELVELKEEFQEEPQAPDVLPEHAFFGPDVLSETFSPGHPMCSSSDPLSDFSPQPWRRPLKRRERERDDVALELLEKMARTDECADFAKDIANDLRKIRDPANLVVTKAAIRRVVENALLRELKGDSQSPPSTNSS